MPTRNGDECMTIIVKRHQGRTVTARGWMKGSDTLPRPDRWPSIEHVIRQMEKRGVKLGHAPWGTVRHTASDLAQDVYIVAINHP